MNWILLVVAGLLEVVWSVGLKYTEGFTRLWPSVVTVAAMLASITLLGIAMKELPVGTAYAVWVGIGAALTVAYAMVTGDEPASLLKIVLILGIVACVVGLKLVSDAH